MLQNIDGQIVFVVEFATLPETPITGNGWERPFADALTEALNRRIISKPGKYAINIDFTSNPANFTIHAINEEAPNPKESNMTDLDSIQEFYENNNWKWTMSNILWFMDLQIEWITLTAMTEFYGYDDLVHHDEIVNRWADAMESYRELTWEAYGHNPTSW